MAGRLWISALAPGRVAQMATRGLDLRPRIAAAGRGMVRGRLWPTGSPAWIWILVTRIRLPPVGPLACRLDIGHAGSPGCAGDNGSIVRGYGLCCTQRRAGRGRGSARGAGDAVRCGEQPCHHRFGHGTSTCAVRRARRADRVAVPVEGESGERRGVEHDHAGERASTSRRSVSQAVISTVWVFVGLLPRGRPRQVLGGAGSAGRRPGRFTSAA